MTATKTKSRNRFYNPNPTKKTDAGDCSVRALCKATGEDWDTVFVGLCEKAMQYKIMPNDNKAWQEYLEDRGFIKRTISNKKGTKRPTVESFSRDNKKGTFVLRVANHIVTVVDGYYYDTWDSGTYSLYGYWEKVE